MEDNREVLRMELFRVAGLIFGFAFLGGIGFLIYYLISSVLHLATVNPTVATAFVTGAITIVGFGVCSCGGSVLRETKGGGASLSGATLASVRAICIEVCGNCWR